MERTLEYVNQFFRVITDSDSHKNNDHLKSEWGYLYNLLKDQPTSNDRIEAYLGILETQSTTPSHKTRKSTTEHRRAAEFKSITNSMINEITSNSLKLIAYEKCWLCIEYDYW